MGRRGYAGALSRSGQINRTSSKPDLFSINRELCCALVWTDVVCQSCDCDLVQIESVLVTE